MVSSRSYGIYLIIDLFFSVLADVFFLRSMTDPDKRSRPVVLFLDLFSRLAFMRIIKTTSADEILRKLDEAENFFGGRHLKFCSDRVIHASSTKKDQR